MTAHLTLVGRLTAAPELKYLDSGKPMARLNVAEDRRVKDPATGEWKDGDPTFWPVTVFGATAESLGNSDLRPGDPVVVVGRVEGRRYTSKRDGSEQTRFEITAEAVGVSLARFGVTPNRDARQPSPAGDTAPAARRDAPRQGQGQAWNPEPRWRQPDRRAAADDAAPF
jgi:single-strand DNA-binding protein